MWGGWFSGYPCLTNEPAELAGGGGDSGLEHSKAESVLEFTGPDFPVGVLLGSSAALINLSLCLPCPYWGGIEETPTS